MKKKALLCGLASLWLTSLSLMAEGNSFKEIIEESENITEDQLLRSKRHRNDRNVLLRTDAVQQSINAASTFALDFSAAVRAPVGSPQQNLLIERVLRNFTTLFTITITQGPVTVVATDFASLQAIVQAFSGLASFDSSIIGNFSVRDYNVDCRRRSVSLDAMEYIIQTIAETGQSFVLVGLDNFLVVETEADKFKIKTLTGTIINDAPFLFVNPAP